MVLQMTTAVLDKLWGWVHIHVHHVQILPAGRPFMPLRCPQRAEYVRRRNLATLAQFPRALNVPFTYAPGFFHLRRLRTGSLQGGAGSRVGPGPAEVRRPAAEAAERVRGASTSIGHRAQATTEGTSSTSQHQQQRPAHRAMKITVRDVGPPNTSCTMSCAPSELVAGLKAKVAEELGTPVAAQRLVFKGRILRPAERLVDVGIVDGDTVLLAKDPKVRAAPAPGEVVNIAVPPLTVDVSVRRVGESESLTLSVAPTERVAVAICLRLATEWGVPAAEQRLVFQGKKVDVAQTVQQAGLVPEVPGGSSNLWMAIAPAPAPAPAPAASAAAAAGGVGGAPAAVGVQGAARDAAGEQGEEEEEEEELPRCRICMEGEEASGELGPLISPCLCRGGMRFVHSRCLNTWYTRIPPAACEFLK